MIQFLLLSVKEARVGKSVASKNLDLFESVEVELPHKAFKFLVPEIPG